MPLRPSGRRMVYDGAARQFYLNRVEISSGFEACPDPRGVGTPYRFSSHEHAVSVRAIEAEPKRAPLTL